MKFLTLFKKHKDYNTVSGYQSLEKMHYFSYFKAIKYLNRFNYTVCDIKVLKLRKLIKNQIVQKKFNKNLSTLRILIYKYLSFFDKKIKLSFILCKNSIQRSYCAINIFNIGFI